MASLLTSDPGVQGLTGELVHGATYEIRGAGPGCRALTDGGGRCGRREHRHRHTGGKDAAG
ncbi:MULTISPECIES: hypothetical protein [Actinoalloteichus]|uniref:hypothetical protein n=1 Tax=Actinoalloteichus TaxID=65496 RepID=UPI000951FD24|nr:MULTISPECIES: hypothetical protein [Actinoalloteichus]